MDSNKTAQQITVRSLGLLPYEDAWARMKQFVTERTPDTVDEIWLLEHPPVFTLGQAGDPQHILNAGTIPVVPSDRGGQVTYHGPGQLIAYLMIDIARKKWHSRALVSRIEQSLIAVLGDLGIITHSRQDAPGVYTEDNRKIASLGLRIKRQSSYHGLALNIDMDLSPFQRINPCGYVGMSMAQVKEFQPDITLDAVASMLTQHLMEQLNYEQINYEQINTDRC